MPQRIVPSKVITVTKDGECHVLITLDLNINLNTNEKEQVKISQTIESVDSSTPDDQTDWVVPDFNDFQAGLLNFGKDVSHGNG